eukprot:gene25364-31814_t
MSVVQTGKSFTYDVAIPPTQPPGLYWYHPHVHHVADNQVMGGATGVIVIEGIEKINPEVAGLPEQIIVLRDYFRGYNPVTGVDTAVNPVAFRDLSVNFIGVPYPDYETVPMAVQPNERQFWRIANSASFTEVNLTLTYDGVPQRFSVVALDGVTVGNGMEAASFNVTSIFIATGGRVEIVVTTPPLGVTGVLATTFVNMQDSKIENPYRPLITLTPSLSATTDVTIPELHTHQDDYIETVRGIHAVLNYTQRLPSDLLKNTHVNRTRHLYFTQDLTDDYDPSFWITESGHEKKLFNISNPAAITVTQGTTEDWIIENRAAENHDFHIHQMHFVLLQRDGVDVSANEQQYYDVINIPHCSALETLPFVEDGGCPSVKVRVDFTGDVVGKFVYHCHVLYHEDHGMMAVIQVVPCPEGATYCRDVDTEGNDSDEKHTTFLIAIGVLAGLVGLLLIGLVVGVVLYYGAVAEKSAASPPATVTPPKSTTAHPAPAAVPRVANRAPVTVDEGSELSEV